MSRLGEAHPTKLVTPAPDKYFLMRRYGEFEDKTEAFAEER